jgi:hypothetical protein
VGAVLITGGRAPAALDLARRFAAAGRRVVVADSTPFYLARATAAADAAAVVPSPRDAPLAFLAAVRALIARHGVTLIVPTCEEVFYLARFAAELRPLATLLCGDLPAMERLHNKWVFAALTRGLCAEAPQTLLLRDRAAVGALADPEAFVFKPAYSRFAVHTLVRPARAALGALRPTPEQPWVAQRFVAGRELCSYSVAREGRLTAHVAYEPAWRVGAGSSVYFRPLADARTEAFAAELVARTRYTGQVAFDYIDDASGRLHVLECNPRATSGVHLFAATDPLVAAFDGTASAVVRPAAPRARMISALMLAVGVGQGLRRRKLGAAARDYVRARDVIWSWRDPLPLLFGIVGIGAFAWAGLRSGNGARAAATRDIEWDGEAIA